MNLPGTELLHLIRSNLKIIRITRKLSPADVFMATSINIEQFENDNSDIELDVLEKLCACYQVPISQFFHSMEQAAENN
jgi:transcriptional regulator with XRE-family HTH domain